MMVVCWMLLLQFAAFPKTQNCAISFYLVPPASYRINIVFWCLNTAQILKAVVVEHECCPQIVWIVKLNKICIVLYLFIFAFVILLGFVLFECQLAKKPNERAITTTST